MKDRKASEPDLKKSEERIRAFIENSTEAIWCIELEQPIAPCDMIKKREKNFILI